MPAVFTDGVARNKKLDIRTCPHFLRVVYSEDYLDNTLIDTLDQPQDEPRPQEKLRVYVMTAGTWSQVFVRPSGGAGGRYESGVYRQLELDAELLETLRDRSAWIAWVTDHGNDAARAQGLDPWEGVAT